MEEGIERDERERARNGEFTGRRRGAASGGSVHVAELNQSQKPVRRASKDHPGDREVRDIVSIFAVTRTARAQRERKSGRRGGGEKGKGERGKNKAISERKHVKSIVVGFGYAPGDFTTLRCVWKSHDRTARSSLRLREATEEKTTEKGEGVREREKASGCRGGDKKRDGRRRW